MNYEELNNISIAEDFKIFHKTNPRVYDKFKEFAYLWIGHELCKRDGDMHRVKISSKHVCGRVRWFGEVETEGNEYKINDAFTSEYARQFLFDHPEMMWTDKKNKFRAVFELRELRRKRKPLTLFPIKNAKLRIKNTG